MPKRLHIFCLTTLILSVLLPAAQGQLGLGNLINPGPLSNPHKSLDGVSNCTTCHATAKGVPNRKCLDCHEEIQTRLTQKKGYHAVQKKDCAACHLEHKGRAYDLSGLTRMRFDHQQTGWPLTGGHVGVECTDCHTQKRKHAETGARTNRTTYLEASADCKSCHESPHKEKKAFLGQCQRCHTTESWTKQRSRLLFSHQKQTRYPLTGAHGRVACAECHTKQIWAPLAFGKCQDCHSDPHGGQFGSNCTQCHSTSAWTDSGSGKSSKAGGVRAGFNHSTTRFPLVGKHQQVSCSDCHRKGNTSYKVSRFARCSDCHTNPHGNQFQVRWTVKNCKSCHAPSGFQKLVRFNHNRNTRYTLQGKHVDVPCKQCHVKGRYRFLDQTPDCSYCHADVHKGRFGTQTCASCHTTDGFGRSGFDHSTTRFPLVAKHKSVACASCHPNNRFKNTPRQCQSCHNDFHRGELGNLCVQCHAPTGFNDVDFNHNRQSRFKLEGQHQKVACNQCHLGYRYKMGKLECADCHLDVHKGQMGQRCADCHSTSGFAFPSGYHDFGAFRIEGIHDLLKCDTCHNDSAPVRTSPLQCQTCHQDPHMGSLTPECYECHGQTTWLPTTFRHAQTGFELSGAHRFVECSSCHANRIFGGLPQACAFCHLGSFNPALPQHAGGNTDCRSCHTTLGWRPAR